MSEYSALLADCVTQLYREAERYHNAAQKVGVTLGETFRGRRDALNGLADQLGRFAKEREAALASGELSDRSRIGRHIANAQALLDVSRHPRSHLPRRRGYWIQRAQAEAMLAIAKCLARQAC